MFSLQVNGGYNKQVFYFLIQFDMHTYIHMYFALAELNGFHDVAAFYNTSLTAVIKPSISSAIHAWISKAYPILK